MYGWVLAHELAHAVDPRFEGVRRDRVRQAQVQPQGPATTN